MALLAASVAASTYPTITRRWSSRYIASQRQINYFLHGNPAWGVANGPHIDSYTDHFHYSPTVFVDHPALTITLGTIFTHLYILMPTALLCALFCARLGTERGQALVLGILPAMSLILVLLLIVGALGSLPPSWPVFVRTEARPIHNALVLQNGWLPDACPWNLAMLIPMLLAFFATVRADPPAPNATGHVWTVIAGTLGMLSIHYDVYAFCPVIAAWLYVWWSAGWTRAIAFLGGVAIYAGLFFASCYWSEVGFTGQNVWQASLSRFSSYLLPTFFWFINRGKILAVLLMTAAMSYGSCRWLPGMTARNVGTDKSPEVGNETAIPALPVASAHRVICFLLYVAFMSAPAALMSLSMYAGSLYAWQYFVLPLVIAAGLYLTARLERNEHADDVHAEPLIAPAGTI